jgi:hypothetical protein
MICVDSLCNHGWKYGKSCHMFPYDPDAESMEELHEMAKRIGLKRSWFQNKRVPHYDLTEGKSKLALLAGAHQCTPTEAVNVWRHNGWTKV